MEMLIKREFYREVRFVDAQALCEQEQLHHQGPPGASGGGGPASSAMSLTLSLMTPLMTLLGSLIAGLFSLVAQLSLFPMALVEAGWSGGWAPVARSRHLFSSFIHFSNKFRHISKIGIKYILIIITWLFTRRNIP
jgi:hypothetical protein